jgi:branched-chain amino acid transport system substrate-binding protein
MNAATSIITLKSPYIVRSSLTLPQNCEVLGTWAFQNGVKKVFTLVSDYAPGLDAEAAFQRAYTAAGGEIIGSVRVPLANPDFSAFVQRAKDSGAEGIFVFVPGGSQPPALAKALVERGMDASKIKIMGQGELSEENALKAIGDAAIGIIKPSTTTTRMTRRQTRNSSPPTMLNSNATPTSSRSAVMTECT